MRKALESIEYVQNASDELRERIVPAFVFAFHQVIREFRFDGALAAAETDIAAIVLSLICSCIALSIAIFTKGKRLAH